MALRRWHSILVVASVVLVVVVGRTCMMLRIRRSLPPPVVREYIKENPEVLKTLPQGVSEETRALDDSVEAARSRLLAGATHHLPRSERDEVLALREKMSEVGRRGMTSREFRRLLELDNKCLRLLTPAEQQEWRLTMQRLSEQAERSTDP